MVPLKGLGAVLDPPVENDCVWLFTTFSQGPPLVVVGVRVYSKPGTVLLMLRLCAVVNPPELLAVNEREAGDELRAGADDRILRMRLFKLSAISRFPDASRATP